MATDDRANYLNALLRNKRTSNSLGNVLVNPSLTNDLAAQAALRTNPSGMVKTTNQPVSSNSNEENWGAFDWIRQGEGFVNNIENSFRKGFLGFFEGIADFGANIVSSIADAAGNHDMANGINDWIKLDLSGQATDFIDKYMNFSDLVTGGNSIYNWANAAQGKQAQVLSSGYKTEAGNFVGGVSESIGNMLPSILIGNAVGGATGKLVDAGKMGAKTAGALTKAADLGTFGLSAAGSEGSQAALQDGATSGQALGYGAAMGGIEVGTELASGAFWEKIPGVGKLFTGDIHGIAKQGEKVTVQKFLANMFEEGFEEAEGDLLQPLAKSIYKGTEAFGEYGTGDYWKNMAEDFAAGSVSAGIMGTAQSVSQNGGLSKIKDAFSRKFGSEKAGNTALQVVTLTEATKAYAQEYDDAQSKGDAAKMSESESKLAEVGNKLTSVLNDQQLTEQERNSIVSALEQPKQLALDIKNDVGNITSADSSYVEESNPKQQETISKEEYDKLPPSKQPGYHVATNGQGYVSNGITPTQKESDSSAKVIKGFSDAYKAKQYTKEEVETAVNSIKSLFDTSSMSYTQNGGDVTVVFGKNKEDTTNKIFAALSIYDEQSALKTFDNAMEESTFQLNGKDDEGKQYSYNVKAKDVLPKSQYDALIKQGHDLIHDVTVNGGKESKIVSLVNEWKSKISDTVQSARDAIFKDDISNKIVNKAKDLRTQISDAKKAQVYGDIKTDEIGVLKSLIDVIPNKLKSHSLNLETVSVKASELLKQYTPENLADAPAGAEYNEDIKDILDNLANSTDEAGKLDSLYEYEKTIEGMEKLIHDKAFAEVEEKAEPILNKLDYLVKASSKSQTLLNSLAFKVSDKVADFENLGNFFDIVSFGKNNDLYKLTYGAIVDGGDAMYKDRQSLIQSKEKAIQSLNGMKWAKDKITWQGYTITKGEAIDILSAIKDEHIKTSMQLGGISQLDSQSNKKIVYSDQAISDLSSLLSSDELKAVDVVRSLYHTKEAIEIVQGAIKANKGYAESLYEDYYPDTSSKGKRAINVNGGDPILSQLSSGTSVNALGRVKVNPNGFEFMDWESRFDSWSNSLTKNKDMGPALRGFYRLINKRIIVDGNKTSIMESLRNKYGTTADKYIKTVFERANEIPVKQGTFTKAVSTAAVGVLGINLSSAMVQPASYFTASNVYGLDTTIGNLLHLSTYANLKGDDKFLLENSGYYANHVTDAEFAKAATLKQKVGKLTRSLLWLSGITDRFTNLMTFEAAQRYVVKNNPSMSMHTEETMKAALPIYHEAFLTTQSNAVPWATSRVRYGDNGEIEMGLWGTFAADPQAKLSNMTGTLKKLSLAYQIKEFSKNDTSEMGKAWYKESDDFIRKEAPKKITTNATALVLSGLFASGVYDFFKRLFGKKDWDDWDLLKMTKEASIQSFVDWVPVIGQIYNAFDNNGDLEPFSLSAVNDLLKSVRTLWSAYQSGDNDRVKRAWLNGLLNAEITGLPFKNLYNIAYSILSLTDQDKAYKLKSAFYSVSSTASSSLQKAIESGDDAKASIYMNSIVGNRVGAISASEQKEILALMKDGQSVLPSDVPTTYTNDKGEEVTISWTDKQSIKAYYAKANALVTKMISSSSYQSLSNESKASAIRYVYSSYREAGLAKVASNYTITKKASYLAKAGLDMSSITSALYAIKSLEATKTQTKKELSLAYINKLSMSKAEKLIVLLLAGYSIDNTSIVKNYLASKGMSSKEISSFLGENKA